MHKRLTERLARLRADERGLTTVEYVIVLALIAALCVALWADFGSKLEGYLTKSVEKIDTHMANPGAGTGSGG